MPPDGLQWIHSAFIIETSPNTHTLCGEITYEATFMGSTVDTDSSPMKYDTSSRQFTFFSDDVNLVGTHDFSITAHLSSYPAMKTNRPVTAQLEVTNAVSCDSPVSVTASTLVPQEYIVAADAKAYQISPYTTDPPDCPITYTFLVNPPGATDVVAFDEATLTFTFEYDASLNVVQDNPYGILVRGTAGTVNPTTGQTILLLTIKNPCLEANYVTFSNKIVTS